MPLSRRWFQLNKTPFSRNFSRMPLDSVPRKLFGRIGIARCASIEAADSALTLRFPVSQRPTGGGAWGEFAHVHPNFCLVIVGNPKMGSCETGVIACPQALLQSRCIYSIFAVCETCVTCGCVVETVLTNRACFLNIVPVWTAESMQRVPLHWHLVYSDCVTVVGDWAHAMPDIHTFGYVVWC